MTNFNMTKTTWIATCIYCERTKHVSIAEEPNMYLYFEALPILQQLLCGILPLSLVEILEELAENGLVRVVADENRIQHTRCSVNFINWSLEIVCLCMSMRLRQRILVIDPARWFATQILAQVSIA